MLRILKLKSQMGNLSRNCHKTYGLSSLKRSGWWIYRIPNLQTKNILVDFRHVVRTMSGQHVQTSVPKASYKIDIYFENVKNSIVVKKMALQRTCRLHWNFTQKKHKSSFSLLSYSRKLLGNRNQTNVSCGSL